MTEHAPFDSEYESLSAQHVSMRRILRLFSPYATSLGLITALILLSSLAGIASPFLLRAIIDEALPNRDLTLLGWLVAGLVGVTAATAIINIGQTIMSAKVGQSIMHDLRVCVYEHLQALSLRWFMQRRTGEIQSRIASDIGGLQALVTHMATEFARNLSVAAMTVVAMLLLDWRLALLSFIVVPPSIWLSHRVGVMREVVTHEQQARIADMSSTVQETLSVSGVILTRTLNRSRYLIDRFRQSSAAVAALEIRAQTTGEWQWSLIYLMLGVLPGMTLLVGGWLIGLGNTVTIGTLMALIALQEQLLWPLEGLLEGGMQARTTRALFTRIFEYLDAPIDIVEPEKSTQVPQRFPGGDVTVDRVCFSYDKDGAETLTDVSIEIRAGTYVAIVGATGSGKTTLGYALARLIDIDQGSIRFDGVAIQDLSFAQLSNTLGVVNQEPFLLNASVVDNLRFAKLDASDREIIDAARIAQIHDMIETLPLGYATMVGERGYRFSGGEKQRIALARTILRDPPILLLDEATSALDALTERAMMDAIRATPDGRTIIVIAHRLSTVRAADQIIVMDRGRVVERGTHAELLEHDGLYARLAAQSP